MLQNQIFFGTSLIILVSFGNSTLYDEPYRPQLHYSPPSGWMNDPNGLVYHDGIFHLFCQYNPAAPLHGNIHWFHAISSDLIQWKNLGIALAPREGNLIFSGGAIIDHDNVTGLQINNNKKTLILVFTAHNINEEKQWLAYSNDGPEYEHFQYYNNNPIIPNPNPKTYKDFRDPSIFKYKDLHFVMILAAYDHIMIYNSPDLLEWKLVSEFGIDEGSHIGTWECPSLFPINVTINGVEIEKYVLIISQTDNAIPSMQYYIGSFDGKRFTNDNSKETELWLDYGPDSYAGITYNQLPDGRRTFISWLFRWEYATHMNFSVWNGQAGIARKLMLNMIGDQMQLSSLPVREFESLRIKRLATKQNIPIENKHSFEFAKNNAQRRKLLIDLEMIFDLTQLKGDDQFDIMFFDTNDNLTISLKANEFTLDRSNAGRTNFPNFGRLWKAPRFVKSSELKLRIILDRSAIEFFADDGLTVMIAFFVSDENIASKMAIHVHSSSRDSMVYLKKLNAYQMKSIWN